MSYTATETRLIGRLRSEAFSATGDTMSEKRITFCFSHTVVLTRHCAFACGYCNYWTGPAHPLPSKKALRQMLRRAAAAGAAQAHFTGGEGIADHQEIASVVRYYGLSDYDDYLNFVFEQALQNGARRALLPVVSLGNLSLSTMRRLRRRVACMRVLLETADPVTRKMAAHAHSSCKSPEKRLETILHAAKASIPVTSGILVGIGESRASRERTLRILAEAQKSGGHIQNIVIQPFEPTPGTPMSDWPAAPAEDVLHAIAYAARVFGPGYPISFNLLRHPELTDAAVASGVTDLDEVELTGDAGCDEATLLRLDAIANRFEAKGWTVEERLPVFPPYLNEDWLSPAVLAVARQLQAVQEPSTSG